MGKDDVGSHQKERGGEVWWSQASEPRLQGHEESGDKATSQVPGEKEYEKEVL